MEVRKPIWSTSSFVLYAGGLTVLGASVGAIRYLSSGYGDAGLVAWILLPLVVLFLIAHAFRGRGEWIPAGLFIVADLVVWIAFLAALLEWWGWFPDDDEGSPFAGWHWALWLILVVAIATAFVDLRQFRFPLLVVFPTVLTWFLVVDVLSGGGDWAAVLTLVIGLVYLAIGTQFDAGPQRPYGFWVHVVSGLLIGGALLQWWNSSDADWALVAVTGLVYVGIARATGRSSWAVLGIGGFLAATVRFVIEWTDLSGFPFFTGEEGIRGWVPPLVFGIVGLFFVLLGLWARGRQEEPAA
ncbi:MAG: hypothetical protein WD067_04300 [Gaiellaceae bacterium]